MSGKCHISVDKPAFSVGGSLFMNDLKIPYSASSVKSHHLKTKKSTTQKMPQVHNPTPKQFIFRYLHRQRILKIKDILKMRRIFKIPIKTGKKRL